MFGNVFKANNGFRLLKDTDLTLSTALLYRECGLSFLIVAGSNDFVAH